MTDFASDISLRVVQFAPRGPRAAIQLGSRE
jgi:hypothetical protein